MLETVTDVPDKVVVLNNVIEPLAVGADQTNSLPLVLSRLPDCPLTDGIEPLGCLTTVIRKSRFRTMLLIHLLHLMQFEPYLQ